MLEDCLALLPMIRVDSIALIVFIYLKFSSVLSHSQLTFFMLKDSQCLFLKSSSEFLILWFLFLDLRRGLFVHQFLFFLVFFQILIH